MSAFAQVVQEAAFSSQNSQLLVEGTVTSTTAYVAQAFRSNNREDPRLDSDGKTCFLLQEQFRGYKNKDGATKKRKALPLVVLQKLEDLSISVRDKAIALLLIGAIFFAMRSCEYLKTAPSDDEKRTKILCLRNFAFKKDGRLVDLNSPHLINADLIIITFEFQKNTKRNQAVHMFKTDDTVLNPVSAWARTIQRILKTVPNASLDSKICLFQEGNKTIEFKSNKVRSKLRSIVDLFGKVELGFGKDDIGLHSIRSGGAMAMFLSGVSEIIIQRVGRWSSDAFLEYIREQVDSFTIGVSQKMLQFERFHHLNAKENEKNTTDSTIAEKDGALQIPFTIHYSSGVLSGNPACNLD